jgi:hypothetical protein
VGSAKHGGDLTKLLLDVLAVGLGENGADDRRDHLLGSFRDHGEDVALEVHPASLPAGAVKDRPDGFLEPGVGVRHDELHPAQAPGLQRPQEAGPKAFVLAVAHVEPEDFPPSVGGHADRDDDYLGHDAVPDARFAVGRVEERIGEVLRGQGPVSELGHFRVQAGTDPGYFGLGDPGVSAERLDKVGLLSFVGSPPRLVGYRCPLAT